MGNNCATSGEGLKESMDSSKKDLCDTHERKSDEFEEKVKLDAKLFRSSIIVTMVKPLTMLDQRWEETKKEGKMKLLVMQSQFPESIARIKKRETMRKSLILLDLFFGKNEFEEKVKLEPKPFRPSKLISGLYSAGSSRKRGKVRLEMEHCAFNGRGNQWNLEVKCRMQDSNRAGKWPNGRWVNINEFYPDAKIEMKHNLVYVTIDSPNENHEFAVFGTPEVNDKKRMQLGLFGEKPVKGKDWKIWAILFDDTMMAFQHVCEMEKGSGRQLLSTLAGLFVANCTEDIKINLSDIELGWLIKGSKMKTIRSNDAWNSPENSADFPRCYFEISHVDKTKQSFICEVTASHEKDTADTDVMAIYEEDKFAILEKSMTFPDRNFAADYFTEMHVFLQMFVIVVVYVIGSACQKDAADADQSPTCEKNSD